MGRANLSGGDSRVCIVRKGRFKTGKHMIYIELYSHRIDFFLRRLISALTPISLRAPACCLRPMDIFDV